MLFPRGELACADGFARNAHVVAVALQRGHAAFGLALGARHRARRGRRRRRGGSKERGQVEAHFLLDGRLADAAFAHQRAQHVAQHFGFEVLQLLLEVAHVGLAVHGHQQLEHLGRQRRGAGLDLGLTLFGGAKHVERVDREDFPVLRRKDIYATVFDGHGGNNVLLGRMGGKVGPTTVPETAFSRIPIHAYRHRPDET